MYRNKWWYRRYVVNSKLHIYMHKDGRVLQSSSREDHLYSKAGFEWVTSVNKYELNADINPFVPEENDDGY